MGNYISTVAGNAFHNLLKLKHVNLAFNKLDHLNSDVFEGTKIISPVQIFSLEFPSCSFFFDRYRKSTLSRFSGQFPQRISSHSFENFQRIEVPEFIIECDSSKCFERTDVL